MDKEVFTTNDLIRYARIILYKQMSIITILMIYIFLNIKFYKNIILTCFILLLSYGFIEFLSTNLQKYFTIKRICNYLGIEFGYCPVLWSNFRDCVLTDEVIALYKNKQYNYFQYSDIVSVELSRKRKGRIKTAGNVYRRYYIYLKIILKDDREFKFLMYSNDYTKCRSLHGIKDICPIILEKNKNVEVIDNSQKGLFDFDFRQ